MTFDELQLDVYEDTGANNPTPSEQTITRIAKNLNKAHRKILTDPHLIRLRHTAAPMTFASVANRAFYGLPSALVSLRKLTERSTMRCLWPKTIDEVREEDPGLTTADTPSWFVPIGYKAVSNVPNSARLWAVSSSISDTTQTVQISGVRSGTGLAADASATLSGSSRVPVGSFIDYVDVLTFTISATALGVVSLYDDQFSGNLLGEIPIGQLSTQYFMIQLYPTPAAAVTYYVDGVYRIPTLMEAQDVPLVPESFHDLLSLYAKEQEMLKSGDTMKAAMWRNEYEEGMMKLRHWVGTQGGDTPVVHRQPRRRVSRYGGNYPTGPF